MHLHGMNSGWYLSNEAPSDVACHIMYRSNHICSVSHWIAHATVCMWPMMCIGQVSMGVGFHWPQLTMIVEKTKSSSYKPQYGLEDMSPRTAAPTPITCIAVTVGTSSSSKNKEGTACTLHLLYKHFVCKLWVSSNSLLPPFEEAVLGR